MGNLAGFKDKKSKENKEKTGCFLKPERVLINRGWENKLSLGRKRKERGGGGGGNVGRRGTKTKPEGGRGEGSSHSPRMKKKRDFPLSRGEEGFAIQDLFGPIPCHTSNGGVVVFRRKKGKKTESIDFFC